MDITNGWDLSLAEYRLQRLIEAEATIKAIRDSQGQSCWETVAELEVLRGIIDELEAKINAYQGEKIDELYHSQVQLKNLPALLVQYRESKGWTQHDLANKANIQASTIAKYERGGYFAASLKRILYIADILRGEE